jgi:hypothetical protein
MAPRRIIQTLTCAADNISGTHLWRNAKARVAG